MNVSFKKGAQKLERSDLPALFELLNSLDYTIIGPTIRDNAIIFDQLDSDRDLPEGWTDCQDNGHYRLEKRNDMALFGFNVGPHSLKNFLHPSRRRLWQADRTDESFKVTPEPPAGRKTAFLGVRSCDLHAVHVQDRVLRDGQFADPFYREMRQQSLIIVVNCMQAGGTCFCVSMGSGPKADSGFDIALTEILDDRRHFFIVECDSPAGADIIRRLPLAEVGESEKKVAADRLTQTAESMGKSLATEGIRETLYDNLDHPRWDDVASRCLSCANCTMACPTCFCSTVEDTSDLSGDHAERWQSWDSCFTAGFTALHKTPVRASTKSRYRQWLTHKLATWIDQFGSSGCVGCGRCITWCPVGIDITEEVRHIQNDG